MTLSPMDQTYFRFFPSSSVVYFYMKPWAWSSFGFLHQGPAAANKLIMRMILALSASDMQRRGLLGTQEASKNHARYHYDRAVREFRKYLEEDRGGISSQRKEGGKTAESECEMIFCTMFLMIMWEWHFGHSVKHLQLHLQGVRCLLKANPEMFIAKDMTDSVLTTGWSPSRKMSFMLAQLLLWILYVLPLILRW